MIKARIQVEEMHVYYFIAKKLISGAKLGIFGMTSGEEKLLKKIYSCSDVDEIDYLVKNLSDRLEEKQAKLDGLVLNSTDTTQFITDAVNCTKDLKYKSDVLDNILKFLKVEFTTSQKIILCIEKIVQAKRILAGLSPEEKKTFLSTTNFDFKRSSNNVSMKVMAVDAENINNKKTALVNNDTGEKLAVSNGFSNNDINGSIINNNIDKNIVKVGESKTKVIADVEVLEEVEELLEEKNNLKVVNKVIKNEAEEVLEPISTISNNKQSLSTNDSFDTRESIESSYVGVLADNFDIDPLEYYSVGKSVCDKDVLEYNIPTIEPAYETIGNFKTSDFGDAFDKPFSSVSVEELENCIPMVEQFSEYVTSNNTISNVDIPSSEIEIKQEVKNEEINNIPVTNEKTSYDEPVIFKIIESDGVPLE